MGTAKEFMELKEEINELRQTLIDILEAPLYTGGPKLGTGIAHYHICSPSRMTTLSAIKERLQSSEETQELK